MPNSANRQSSSRCYFISRRAKPNRVAGGFSPPAPTPPSVRGPHLSTNSRCPELSRRALGGSQRLTDRGQLKYNLQFFERLAFRFAQILQTKPHGSASRSKSWIFDLPSGSVFVMPHDFTGFRHRGLDFG